MLAVSLKLGVWVSLLVLAVSIRGKWGVERFREWLDRPVTEMTIGQGLLILVFVFAILMTRDDG
jgi:hypothetical protein